MQRAAGDRDDSGCRILHVDMDAFYASVEQRRRPELRGRPVLVGGSGPRGVVASASYEARAYGVRSAMPGRQAQRLCPDAVFLPPDMAAYHEASRAVMAIFSDVTPLVEPLSVDEAFLDVAGAVRLLGPPRRIAQHIRERVATEQRLTCSVGVASTKFMAKLASTRAKPDGLLVVPVTEALAFLHPLDVDVLWGVGERSAEALRRMGLRTVGDVAAAPIGLLRRALGAAAADHLHELAHGRDPRQVSTERVDKSIGAETTFDIDVADQAAIRRTLLALSERVGGRLRAAALAGRTVSVKVRFADFRTVNRSRTLAVPTDVGREIFEVAWELCRQAAGAAPLRLVGVRAEGLVRAAASARQPAIGEREHGWREAERASDAVAARFGLGAVRPASLLGQSGERAAGSEENTHLPDKSPQDTGSNGRDTPE